MRAASVLKSFPQGVFDDSLLTAILKWRFKPALRAGEPVNVIVIAPVMFELGGIRSGYGSIV